MPDIVPYAVLHIGISLALAVILTICYRKLSADTFLVYWALFWVSIAADLVFGPLSQALIPYPPWQWLLRFSVFMSIALFPSQAAFMVCAAVAVVKKDFSNRSAGRWLAAIMTAAVCAAMVQYAIY